MIKSSHNLERQGPILTGVGLFLAPNLHGIFSEKTESSGNGPYIYDIIKHL